MERVYRSCSNSSGGIKCFVQRYLVSNFFRYQSGFVVWEMSVIGICGWPFHGVKRGSVVAHRVFLSGRSGGGVGGSSSFVGGFGWRSSVGMLVHCRSV